MDTPRPVRPSSPTAPTGPKKCEALSAPNSRRRDRRRHDRRVRRVTDPGPTLRLRHAWLPRPFSAQRLCRGEPQRRARRTKPPAEFLFALQGTAPARWQALRPWQGLRGIRVISLCDSWKNGNGGGSDRSSRRLERTRRSLDGRIHRTAECCSAWGCRCPDRSPSPTHRDSPDGCQPTIRCHSQRKLSLASAITATPATYNPAAIGNPVGAFMTEPPHGRQRARGRSSTPCRCRPG